MNQQPISSTVLEDFLESIEHLPGELLEGFLFLKEQECVLDEARRRCHKARFNYFKLLSNAGESANPPQVDSQGALDQQKKKWLKSIEEESQKSLTSLDNKLNCTRELKASVEQYLATLDFEMDKLESSMATSESMSVNPIGATPKSSLGTKR